MAVRKRGKGKMYGGEGKREGIASSERDKEGVRVHRSINQDNERQVEVRRTSRQRRKGRKGGGRASWVEEVEEIETRWG